MATLDAKRKKPSITMDDVNRFVAKNVEQNAKVRVKNIGWILSDLMKGSKFHLC